jgi:nucleotide-binding universal stress UspA family protein
MSSFQKVLIVAGGTPSDGDALHHGLRLARQHDAKATVLVVCPALPDRMEAYRERYESGVREHVEAEIERVRSDLGSNGEPPTIELDCGSTPGVRIIRRVLSGGFDVVVKSAAPATEGRGFRALDMQLLRKCPCPVWLCREGVDGGRALKFAVAVDPGDEASGGQAFSVDLLRTGAALAAGAGDAELTVVSCWAYEFAGYLGSNPWLRISADEVRSIVEEARAEHRAALDATVAAAELDRPVTVRHVQGRPSETIPSLIVDMGVDVLVMGTVARTGIPGFIIGNTAEDVLHELRCSLVALKPAGFVSPIKPG